MQINIMKVNCTKAEAAVRQLDVAIALLFNDSDPLAIRTLSAASHGIFADLADTKNKGSSWRSKLIEDSGLSKNEAIRILNETQNYLKHADQDSTESLSFEEEENDHLIFVASLECGGLGYQLSPRMQAFQVWFLASHPEKLGKEQQITLNAIAAFPELTNLPRRQSLAHGKEFMLKSLDKFEES